ncbi:MAG: outer-membrane lipoprotein carrier protein LolA [Treponemataceae bacterium]|nr:outer-membrane lipoprotein carrier protein LolA [Treponemataceae bacterium]
MRKGCGLVVFVVFLVNFLVVSTAQEIVTADKFLAQVGEVYNGIKDYQARLKISSGKSDMEGTIIYRAPNLMRMDFSVPQEQVIVYNGEVLMVYLPEYRAILRQEVTGESKSSGATFASSQGLVLLRRNYLPAYQTGPDPVPLDDKNATPVVKLILTRRNVSEGFREIRLSIDPQSKLIYRIEARTVADELIVFNFSNIVLNQGIPEGRFAYDAPASANVYNNFLFKSSN